MHFIIVFQKKLTFALLVLFIFLNSTASGAFELPPGGRTERYTGVAKNDKGETLYLEKHEVSLDAEKKVLRAKTAYVDTDGKTLGEMTSDFTQSLTAPAYVYKDYRFNNQHGIRYGANELVLFSTASDGSEKSRSFAKGFAPAETLVVGCQGLHYYLRSNIQNIELNKKIPIQFMIPGELDYYAFRMRKISEDADTAKLQIDIDNFFLRLFAPNLVIEYDKKQGRLLNYFGVSNIKSKDNKVQTVRITYSYGDT